MKKFKDFLYNYNDIVLAIVILLLALGVIAWRTQVIMDYPKTLTETSQTQQQEQSQDANQNQAKEQSDTAKTDANSQSQTQSNQNGVWNGDKLAKATTVEIKSGATAEEALKPLFDAKLFTDYQEFANVCKSAGTNPEAVKAGTFTFNAGSTKADIVKKVTQ